MTERLGRGDRQRGVARITLVLLAIVQAVVLMATMSDGLLSAFAQPGPSASPTGSRNASVSPRQSPSAQPSPTGGRPQIEFLNPSKYETPEIVSDKPDNDEAYHLVAWVANRPADAIVVFKAQPTDGGNEVTICEPATRVPSTNDTYECFWDLDAAGTPSDDYNVHAILYSNTATPSGSPSGSPSPTGTGPREVDRDTETVTADDQAETVEIEYPVNGGAVGVYDPVGPQPAAFVMDVQTSEDADNARAFYSESPVGTEPSWKTCRQQTTVFFSDGTQRIGCELQDGDDETTLITAVAAVATTDDPDRAPGPPPIDDPCIPVPTATNCPGDPTGIEGSGDAHRVTRYVQRPNSVELPAPSRNTPNQNGNFSCQELTATVRDQSGRPIWRVNMDVHAQGPGDEVRFGSIANRTNRFKAPDQGNHTTENTDTCAADPAQTNSPSQGRHPTTPGNDSKHIESVEGSDTSGRFTFAVRSPGPEGTSTVTAWADQDDNDERQTAEPFDTTTVNFTRNTASTSPSASASSASPTATESQSASASTTSPSTTASSASPGPAQTLNCEPETDTNPAGSNHTFVCTVTESSSPRSGVRVDVEATGANDSDGDSRNSPDFTCTTTGESGSCNITHGPGGAGDTTDTGTTVYRA